MFIELQPSKFYVNGTGSYNLSCSRNGKMISVIVGVIYFLKFSDEKTVWETFPSTITKPIGGTTAFYKGAFNYAGDLYVVDYGIYNGSYYVHKILTYDLVDGIWVRSSNEIFVPSGFSSNSGSVKLAVSNDGLVLVAGWSEISNNYLRDGIVVIYDRINGAWVLREIINNPFEYAGANQYFGHSVSINADGTNILIGAIKVEYHGRVYEYQYSEGAFHIINIITPILKGYDSAEFPILAISDHSIFYSRNAKFIKNEEVWTQEDSNNYLMALSDNFVSFDYYSGVNWAVEENNLPIISGRVTAAGVEVVRKIEVYNPSGDCLSITDSDSNGDFSVTSNYIGQVSVTATSSQGLVTNDILYKINVGLP